MLGTSFHSSLVVLILCSLISVSQSLLPGLYCGVENCYDVLNVTRESSKGEIAKSYRKLAAKFHPDKQRGSEEENSKAEERFRTIAVAYETLRDEESKKDYDYMLDNPDEVYRHYYYYYRHQVAPKVDVRYVILATIAIVSIIQYISAWQKYSEAISYLYSTPKYRMKAMEIAKERGLLLKDDKKGKRRKMNKEEAKEEEESVLKSIIQENIDLRGGHTRPSYQDLLITQIVILPYTAYLYLKWYCRWVWKFQYKKEEFGEDEKLYIIRKNLKLSQSQFDCLEHSEIDEYMSEELWIPEIFGEWKKKKDDKDRAALAENSQHKRYRRYMKKGVSQMTFLDD